MVVTSLGVVPISIYDLKMFSSEYHQIYAIDAFNTTPGQQMSAMSAPPDFPGENP